MKRSLGLMLFAVGLPLLLWGRAADPPGDGAAVAGDDNLVVQVKKAIDRGVRWLRNQQRKEGGWEAGNGADRRDNVGGRTALIMLALLNSGVPATDPAIQNGLTFLRKCEPYQTYVIGLQTMVFCITGDKRDRKSIERNVRWLEEALQDKGWSYLKERGRPDNSNSQYALLGLHEAALAGYPVSAKTLAKVQALYRETQVKGGWAYQAPGTTTTMTMTTAGLCNLLIAGLDLARGEARLNADGSADKCGQYKDNVEVARAIAWIGERFPAVLDNESAAGFVSPFYALYGLERAGRLSGQRFFGGHDWYEVGCRWLVSAQKANGTWQGDGGRGFDNHPLIATSFSLLFLSKGRTPLLISKMAYGDPTGMGWNNKRSDVKHLVDFCSTALFKGQPLAWQIYDIRTAEAATEAAQRKLAAQLLQSPVVWINGHDRAPRGKEAGVLKAYLENGGFLMAETCCGAAKHEGFDTDFRRLIREIFPDSKLEKLEADHPIWLASGKFASSPKDFPLEGVKQGCKTVAVYSPVPLAGYWEANLKADRGKGQKAFELGANIIAYATGLEAPSPRLTRVEVASDAREPVRRGFLQVGQLRHGGDWQPAPKAMRNLMAQARKAGLDVILRPEPVFPSDEKVLDYKFLYMHGRKNFEAKREDLKDIRFALRSGSVLFADACCGARAFDTSFRAFVQELFGDEKLKLEPVPTNDRLFSSQLNGSAIKMVRRREGKELRSVPPALEGIRYKGRWVVLYSKWDIGCALEKHASAECKGHDHESAVRLGRAAILYALTR